MTKTQIKSYLKAHLCNWVQNVFQIVFLSYWDLKTTLRQFFGDIYLSYIIYIYIIIGKKRPTNKSSITSTKINASFLINNDDDYKLIKFELVRFLFGKLVYNCKYLSLIISPFLLLYTKKRKNNYFKIKKEKK